MGDTWHGMTSAGDVAALTEQCLRRYGDRWQARGRVSIRHLADFGRLLMCRVAFQPSPTETKPRRRRQRCAELRHQSPRYGLLFITSFQICICVYGCHNSPLFPILSLSLSNG
jgi:hypothetical protein